MADAPDPELPILLQALEQPLGLVVAVEDFTKARGRLVYVVTKQEQGLRAQLQRLSFRRSPYNPERELWIVSQRERAGNSDQPSPVGLGPSSAAPDEGPGQDGDDFERSGPERG